MQEREVSLTNQNDNPHCTTSTGKTMNNLANTLNPEQSLALYINRARLQGMSMEDCLCVADYHEAFQPYEAPTRESILEIAGQSVVSLDDIDVSQDGYRKILFQLQKGIPPWQVELPYPPVISPEKGLALDGYYNRYLKVKNLDSNSQLDYEVKTITQKIESLLNGKAAGEQRSAGLIVGRVQSGKTTNYTGVILKAAANGFNVFIVLTSNNSSLADQTALRLGCDLKRCGLTASNCSYVNFLASGHTDLPDLRATAESGFFYWGVCMKEARGMERLGNWLENNRAYAPNMKVLVIDDESDNASQDTQSGRKTRFTEDEMDALFDTMEVEEEGRFALLAQKMKQFQCHVQNDVLPEEEVSLVNALSQKLENGRSGKRLFTEILETEDDTRLLGFDENSHDENGNLVSYVQMTREFFSEHGKGSLRAPASFPKMLNTILDVTIQRSRINHDLCSMLGKGRITHEYAYPFARCVYLGYTATPYACILNETPDNTPLYAEFIFAMTQSRQYFGFSEIFGDDLSTDKPQMNIVRFFPDEKGDCGDGVSEVDDVLLPIEAISPQFPKPCVAIDENLNCRTVSMTEAKEWSSMKNALKWTLCAAGCRRYHRLNVFAPSVLADTTLSDTEKQALLNDISERWTTMLVNISQKKDVHTFVGACLLKYIAKHCGTPEARARLLAECKAIYETETTAFSKKEFDSLFNAAPNAENSYGEIEDYPAWENIEEHVLFFLERWNDLNIHIREMNSSHKCYKEYTQTDKDGIKLTDDQLWIICGGNTISRGLTLQGLVTSYFDRVHRSIAVDTMTQMSRWFGYRKGYELLPRIWMNKDAVMDMKKTAIVENEMHILMKENFDNGYSPRDLEHYQMVYYYGRRLSGRDKAKETAYGNATTTFSTDDISLQQNSVAAIHGIVSDFIANDCGEKDKRDEKEYRFSSIPLWKNVPNEQIVRFFQRVRDAYPMNSKTRIDALLRELERLGRTTGEKTDEIIWPDSREDEETAELTDGDALTWDVVIGEPQRGSSTRRPLGGEEYLCGHPKGVEIKANELMNFKAARLNIPWFAMLPNTAINKVDCELLEQYFSEVEVELAKRLENKAVSPEFELGEGLAEDNLHQRLEELLMKMKTDPQKALPDCYHSSLFRDIVPGFGNRWSSSAYCTAVHGAAEHSNPILQIYLIEPPENNHHGLPLIALSVFWAGHSPVPFATVCARRKLEAHVPKIAG